MKKLILLPILFAATAFGQLSITPQTSYTFTGGVSTALAPADATTYYFGWNDAVTITAHSAIANVQMTVPKAGTIRQIIWQVFVVTNGTNEATSHFLRVNNTTDTTLSTSETYDPGANTVKTFTYNGLSIPVAAGDTIAFKLVCPTWTTNPTFGSATLHIFVQ